MRIKDRDRFDVDFSKDVDFSSADEREAQARNSAARLAIGASMPPFPSSSASLHAPELRRAAAIPPGEDGHFDGNNIWVGGTPWPGTMVEEMELAEAQEAVAAAAEWTAQTLRRGTGPA